MNNYLLITTLLGGLLLTGCSNHVLKKDLVIQANNKVVWADDGSDVVVVKHNKDNPSNQAHFKHQVSVQNIDGSGQRTITEWRDYQVDQIFYMKQAGYFIVESKLDNGVRRFDKINASGHEILIIETPDSEHQPCRGKKNTASNISKLPQVHHTVIPSPDGQQLAHIYSPECRKVTVEFLHANNLNIFDNQTVDIDEPMKTRWHSDGYVILSTYNNDKAWKIIPLTLPLPVLPPKCLLPVTTSSDVSLGGKKVYFEGNKLATKDVGRQKAFGCQ
ncbi:hypothetical protein [Candidatus Parabeggiatoa sp. HSG14]|uniref:hypothetical protein n=1 Tax=Candidatus Parabeggiatoa sp. HSG14 TaxID=3055593 RepID=UPI0025A72CF9|nr:hypothetical protein [Thiotrichales bacterium HSG14]